MKTETVVFWNFSKPARQDMTPIIGLSLRSFNTCTFIRKLLIRNEAQMART